VRREDDALKKILLPNFDNNHCHVIMLFRIICIFFCVPNNNIRIDLKNETIATLSEAKDLSNPQNFFQKICATKNLRINSDSSSRYPSLRSGLHRDSE